MKYDTPRKDEVVQTSSKKGFLGPLVGAIASGLGASTAVTAVATGIGSAVSGFIGANSAKKADAATMAYNAKQARLADKRAWRYKKKELKYRDRQDNVATLRKKYEDAGFNPLSLMGTGVSTSGAASGQGTFSPAAYNGAAQGQMIADGLTGAFNGVQNAVTAQQQLEIQKAELEMKQQSLAELSRQVSLNPNVPGIYQRQRESFDTGPYADPDFYNEFGQAVNRDQVNIASEDSPTHVVYDAPGEGTAVASGGGIIETLSEFYGDEPSEWYGYVNMAKDLYHGHYREEAFDPKWKYESEWPRPRYRPSRTVPELPEYYKNSFDRLAQEFADQQRKDKSSYKDFGNPPKYRPYDGTTPYPYN